MFDFLSDAGAWLGNPENVLTVMTCFIIAFVIMLLVNMGFMIRTERRISRRVRETFFVGSIVILDRDMLLPSGTLNKGRRGMIGEIFERPRLKIERNEFRKLALVRFDDVVVPITSGEARNYFDLKAYPNLNPPQREHA